MATRLGRSSDGGRVGEVSKFSALEQAQIQRQIREKNPDQLQLPFALWAREAVVTSSRVVSA
jgi:hypothetical protein